MYTFPTMVHSEVLLHLAIWFTLTYCHILEVDSLDFIATSATVVLSIYVGNRQVVTVAWFLKYASVFLPRCLLPSCSPQTLCLVTGSPLDSGDCSMLIHTYLLGRWYQIRWLLMLYRTATVPFPEKGRGRSHRMTHSIIPYLHWQAWGKDTSLW